jgi:hypothetical protein
MSLRLKSAGATYQRGIQRCLHSQLGRNVEAYVHDVVIKIWEDEGLISNLAESFDNLRKFKMKLNPEKCTFDVPSGKLIRYMASHHGIDPNPDVIEPPQDEGFISQDHIRGFSTKLECRNTHIKAYNTIYMKFK